MTNRHTDDMRHSWWKRTRWFIQWHCRRNCLVIGRCCMYCSKCATPLTCQQLYWLNYYFETRKQITLHIYEIHHKTSSKVSQSLVLKIQNISKIKVCDFFFHHFIANNKKYI
jgi:hypothetical protein